MTRFLLSMRKKAPIFSSLRHLCLSRCCITAPPGTLQLLCSHQDGRSLWEETFTSLLPQPSCLL